MWAYKIIRKETRSHVPKFGPFLRQNHDLLKFWYEEETEPLEDRTNFLLRFLRFSCYLLLLFLFVNVIINPKDSYYHSECGKR